MKIKQFKPENEYIQKYRNLIKNKDEILVGDFSEEEDEDVEPPPDDEEDFVVDDVEREHADRHHRREPGPTPVQPAQVVVGFRLFAMTLEHREHGERTDAS